jgi:hypothetical protein
MLRHMLYVCTMFLMACGMEGPVSVDTGEYYQVKDGSCKWDVIRVSDNRRLTLYKKLNDNCWEFELHSYELIRWDGILLKPRWKSIEAIDTSITCPSVDPVMSGPEEIHVMQDIDDKSFEFDNCLFLKE